MHPDITTNTGEVFNGSFDVCANLNGSEQCLASHPVLIITYIIGLSCWPWSEHAAFAQLNKPLLDRLTGRRACDEQNEDQQALRGVDDVGKIPANQTYRRHSHVIPGA